MIVWSFKVVAIKIEQKIYKVNSRFEVIQFMNGFSSGTPRYPRVDHANPERWSANFGSSITEARNLFQHWPSIIDWRIARQSGDLVKLSDEPIRPD
jgi:hypothetical protein